jgi:hypothetical protein
MRGIFGRHQDDAILARQPRDLLPAEGASAVPGWTRRCGICQGLAHHWPDLAAPAGRIIRINLVGASSERKSAGVE